MSVFKHVHKLFAFQLRYVAVFGFLWRISFGFISVCCNLLALLESVAIFVGFLCEYLLAFAICACGSLLFWFLSAAELSFCSD